MPSTTLPGSWSLRLKCAEDVVDVAALVIVIDHAAHGEFVGDRNVHRGVEAAVRSAVAGEAGHAFRVECEGGGIGLVRDVADGAGFRAAAEQRALRTFEHFDALHVDHVDVDVAGRELHRLFVEIDRDVGIEADGSGGLVAAEAVAQAAHEDFALARAVVAVGHAGRVFQKVFEVIDVLGLQLIARERLDAHRHLFDRLCRGARP